MNLKMKKFFATSAAIIAALSISSPAKAVTHQRVTDLCMSLHEMTMVGIKTRYIVQGWYVTADLSDEARQLLYKASQTCPQYF